MRPGWRKSSFSGAGGNDNCVEVWRKSSFSGDGGNDNCVEVWLKSTYSGAGGNDDCVEVSLTTPPLVAVRDSKNPGLVIRVPAPAWDNFLRDLS